MNIPLGIYVVCGDAYSRLNEFEKAMEMYEKALNNYSSNPEDNIFFALAYYGKGRCNEEIGKYKKAIENYEMALTFDSKNKLVNMHLIKAKKLI